MKIQTTAALILAAGLPTALLAANYPEAEPNETKAQAQARGVYTLAPGDSLTGISTGTSTTSGGTSADTFLIRTTAAPLGIYRHRLVITTPGSQGHTGSIRGLSASSTGANTASDIAFQLSSSSTSPARMNQWFGFGKQERLYYRVTGDATTTLPYIATLSTIAVTPVAAPTAAYSGTITITDATSTTTSPYDNDMFLFDSNLNPIVGYDDPDSSGIVAILGPGTYYVAFGSFNAAAGTLAGAVTAPAIGGIQGTYQNGDVLDFDNLVASNRSTATMTTPTSISIASTAGTQVVPGSILGWGDVQWFTFTVVQAPNPTWPSGFGSATPRIVSNDGTGTTTLRVNVTPGANPTSTFATTGSVTWNGSGVGAGTVTLRDDGVAPDVVAGDNIFSAFATVANGASVGNYGLSFNITDDQGRIASDLINLTVTTPPPPCSSGVSTLSFSYVSSNGPVGDFDNSVVTGDFGFAGEINRLLISGGLTAFAPSFRSESCVRATSPSGSIYQFTFGLPDSAGTSDVIDFPVTFAQESGTGTWTFEFFDIDDDFGAFPESTWQAICFAANQVSTPLSATDNVAPISVARDGVTPATLTVAVTPGFMPISTGLAVVANCSSIGGPSLVTLQDDGVAPDAVAGDNIFTAYTTVSYTTPLGIAHPNYAVSDDQGRTHFGVFDFIVTEAYGACCTTSGCQLTSIGNCLDVQGGTFAGSGTACISPTALTTEGAGGFQDIGLTGSIIPALNGGDDLSATVPLGFTFNYFGNPYTSVIVSNNGYAQFSGPVPSSTNTNLPNAAAPNDALYPLWDDLDFGPTGHALVAYQGTPGIDQRVVIQWDHVGQFVNSFTDPTDASKFQLVLFENGAFEFRYASISPESVSNDTTTIGFENADGSLFYQAPLSRATLAAQLPISLRANTQTAETGVCDTPCPECAADYDDNGGVDGGDLAAFFSDFEAGEPCADVDGNGGVDGGDLAYFFFVFEQGGC